MGYIVLFVVQFTVFFIIFMLFFANLRMVNMIILSQKAHPEVELQYMHLKDRQIRKTLLSLLLWYEFAQVFAYYVAEQGM